MCLGEASQSLAFISDPSPGPQESKWGLSVSGVSGVMGVGFEYCQNRSEGQLLEKSCPV